MTLPFPTILLSPGSGPHGYWSNIWQGEHWHPFLCNQFLFCILMGSLNQNTLHKPKEKMANYPNSRTDHLDIFIIIGFLGTSNPLCKVNKCPPGEFWGTETMVGYKLTGKFQSGSPPNHHPSLRGWSTALFLQRMTKKRVKPWKLPFLDSACSEIWDDSCY